MKQQILFRLDDICPTMNWAKFNRVRAIFDKYGIKPIIGVVPDCQDEVLNVDNYNNDFWRVIKELQNNGWKVAMHGYQHQYVTKSKGLISYWKRSEFAGLSYDEQKEKIQKGLGILKSHEIDTDLFMAPSHSFDKNTIKALKDCGFKYVTDGLTVKPYFYEHLLFIPCIDFKIKNKKRFSTVCYHLNNISENEITNILMLCEKNRDRLICFEESIQAKTTGKFSAFMGTVWFKIYRKIMSILSSIYHKIKK